MKGGHTNLQVKYLSLATHWISTTMKLQVRMDLWASCMSEPGVQNIYLLSVFQGYLKADLTSHLYKSTVVSPFNPSFKYSDFSTFGYYGHCTQLIK